MLLPGLYGGGAERTMLNLTQGIAARGHPVDLVLVQAEGPYLADIPDSVRVVDLGNGRLVRRNRTVRRLPALVRYLRAERPAAMVSALRRTNLVALWARKLTGVPRRLLVCEQSHVSEEVARLGTPFMRAWPHLARRFYPWADAVVGVSQGVVDDLIEYVGVSPDLATVVFNPVITPEVRQRVGAPLDHPWFRSGEPPVVLGVGRLMQQKDFPTLIRAVSLLRRDRRVRLLILGEGEERPTLEALAEELELGEDFSLPGFVDNPYPFMKRVSAFVLSSRWEGLPTVLIEVLYCGAPVVATDCPSGPYEILDGGKLGRLVPMGNPVAMAESIAAVLDGDHPVIAESDWRPYTLESVSDRYIDLLSRSGPR